MNLPSLLAANHTNPNKLRKIKSVCIKAATDAGYSVWFETHSNVLAYGTQESFEQRSTIKSLMLEAVKSKSLD